MFSTVTPCLSNSTFILRCYFCNCSSKPRSYYKWCSWDSSKR